MTRLQSSEAHYQYRAWIAVSRNYNIKELLKKIIRTNFRPRRKQISLGCPDSSLNTEQLLNMMDDSQLGADSQRSSQ
uniref:NBS-LRR disease resistance protein n=1 Tax=Zingiber officinale TaxID=94328 RepID=A4UQJ3_ZINOF|nr:NBS-LRR disease resistance protein [Zingiber officinale]